MDLIEEYRESLNQVVFLTKTIDEFLKGIKTTRLFSKERKDYRKRIHLLREDLDSERNKVKKITKELNTLSTFDSDFILPIIKDYVSDVEGEEYYLIKIKEDDYDDYYYPSGNAVESPIISRRFGSTFNIITTLENKSTLENSISQKYLSNYLDLIKNNKYVCLDDTKTQTLLNGLELSELFTSYPYLKDFSIELLNMRLENPNISNDEIKDKLSNNVHTKKR